MHAFVDTILILVNSEMYFQKVQGILSEKNMYISINDFLLLDHKILNLGTKSIILFEN